MIVFSSLLAIAFSFIAALYLQLPTFILGLGYGWSHNYESKRWVCRIVAILAFVFFLYQEPSVGLAVLVAIPFLFFWIFSLFNANPNLFIALGEEDIVKQTGLAYPEETEVVGVMGEEGTPVCYPIKEMVMPRHFLNDRVDGVPLLVSYCAACRSTMVYSPEVGGKRLTFEVVGVRRRNMVIRDRETGTIWQQGTGEAMYGKLKGTRLDFLPYQQIGLKDWLDLYPNSIIALEAKGIRQGFVSKRRLMGVLEKVTSRFIAPGKTALDGLPAREKVWGVSSFVRFVLIMIYLFI